MTGCLPGMKIGRLAEHKPQYKRKQKKAEMGKLPALPDEGY
jgi:hypothetical protein